MSARTGLPIHSPFFSTSGKARDDLVGNAGQHTVGQPGDGILFMQHHRPAEQGRHHAAREGDVAAHAEHHVGFDTTDLPQRLAKPRSRLNRQQQLAQHALAAQGGEAHPGDFVAARRHDARLHAVRIAHPHHPPAARAQGVGNREAGIDVATGTAGHDHQGGIRHAPPHELAVLPVDPQQDRERDAVGENSRTAKSSSAAASGPWWAAGPC
jgi:hypothetical protein